MSQARQDGISLRQWLPLIGLACCAFVFNTSEFMPIGLLTDIAASFSLTEAQAGIMISVYAWGVMLLSLPLMVFASRFEFKRMLLGVLAVFSLGQFLSAVAPTYPILVCARLVVACSHAVFWSVASIIASRLVDTRHGALAISMIATGSSIAQIFGLPLGRAIGLAVGWRMTFAVVGAFSAVAVVYQAAVFPVMPAGERFTVKQLPELLKNPFLIALYAVTVFMATGYYAGYSYIEPFLAQVAHVDAGAITMTLTAFGCSGLVGSWRSADCSMAIAFRSWLSHSPACLWLCCSWVRLHRRSSPFSLFARYGAAAPRPLTWRFRPSSSSTRRRIRRPSPCRSSRACLTSASARAPRSAAPWFRVPVSPGLASRAGRLPSWASSSPLRCCSRPYAAQSPSPNHVPSSVAVE